jgi:hypothetical protein
MEVGSQFHAPRKHWIRGWTLPILPLSSQQSVAIPTAVYLGLKERR